MEALGRRGARDTQDEFPEGVDELHPALASDKEVAKELAQWRNQSLKEMLVPERGGGGNESADCWESEHSIGAVASPN